MGPSIEWAVGECLWNKYVVWRSNGLMNGLLLKYQMDRNRNFTWGNQVYEFGQFGDNRGEPGMSCQTLINKRSLGQFEGPSGLLLHFSVAPHISHPRQNQLISFLLTQGSLHVSYSLKQTSQSTNLQPGHPNFNLRRGCLYLCRAGCWIPSQCFGWLAVDIISIHSDGKTGKERVVQCENEYFLV